MLETLMLLLCHTVGLIGHFEGLDVKAELQPPLETMLFFKGTTWNANSLKVFDDTNDHRIIRKCLKFQLL